MKEIAVTKDTLNIIRKCVNDHDIIEKVNDSLENPQIIKGKYPTGKYIIKLSEEDIQRIIDGICDELMRSGIGEDGEVNEYGRILDDYIGFFVEESYS